MNLLPSKANAGELECYTWGACHHLAIALNRKLGWAIQVQTDSAEPYWQDENDADNFLPAVLHVYAIDPSGRAWDVRGCRPESDINQEIEDHYAPSEPGSELVFNEDGLRCYVGCWSEDDLGEDIDRPLDEYTEQDIAEAWEMAVRIFEGMAGFDPHPPPALPKPRFTRS